MPNAFGGKAGPDEFDSHFFPQDVLAEGMADSGGARASLECETGFPLCSVVITALSGAGSALRLLNQKPRGLGSRWLCSL